MEYDRTKATYEEFEARTRVDGGRELSLLSVPAAGDLVAVGIFDGVGVFDLANGARIAVVASGRGTIVRVFAIDDDAWRLSESGK